MTTFYLGIHHPSWIERDDFADVPVCLSRNRLVGYKTLPRARGPVLFDSGGFSVVQNEGRWPITPKEYLDQVKRIVAGLGRIPDGIAPMDAMCEPWVIRGGWHDGMYFHGTRAWRGVPDDGPDEHLDAAVFKHLWWTVTNFVKLRHLAPTELKRKLFPVLQGWRLRDYALCADMYGKAGVDLRAEPLVGLGSVCRRQNTAEIAEIVRYLAGLGLSLHGFGVKTDGLAEYAGHLASADSMAWSKGAWKGRIQLPGHTHANCANCPDYALVWRDQVLDAVTQGVAATSQRREQETLFSIEMAAGIVSPPLLLSARQPLGVAL